MEEELSHQENKVFLSDQEDPENPEENNNNDVHKMIDQIDL